MSVIAIRTVIIYVFIVVALRVTGKRQLGELQPSELVVTLLISDLAVIPMQETGIPLLSGLIPIAILVSLELILSTLMMKSNRLAQLISGNPVVVIHSGTLCQKSLRRLRLSVDDLAESLRQQGIFDIREVEYAIAETNGKISVFPYQNKPSSSGAFVPIISDGQPVKWGLAMCKKTPEQVDALLQKHHYSKDQVLLMSADDKGHLHIITKNN